MRRSLQWVMYVAIKSIVVSCLLLFISGLVQAQQQDQSVTTFKELTIKSDWLGYPTPETVKSHPGARTVITNKELTESGARTVEDALRNVPGVRVFDESGTGILPNIGIRGLSPLRSEQALILVDGIPVTLAPYGQTGLSLFPLTMNAIESIDVARGGVAVHYGPNNVGGVINFVTKRIPAKKTMTIRETLSLSPSTERMLADSYIRVGGFVNDKLGLQLQGNFINGDSIRAHSDTQVTNIMADVNWYPANNIDIKGSLQYYKTKNNLPGALTPESYKQDRHQSTRPLDRFTGDTLRGSLIYNQYFDNGAEFSWTNFAHRSNRQFFFGDALNADDTSTLERSSPREFLVYGSEPRLSFYINKGIKQKISIGARYMREEVDYIVDARDLLTNEFSVARDWRFGNHAFAAYISDTFFLFDDKLKITPGVRREQVYLDFRNNQTGSKESNPTKDWLPGVDIGYQITDAIFLFGNFHESLRPVQFTQITFGGAQAAERADNFEVGLRLTPLQNIGVNLAAFRIDFDNKLEFVSQDVGFRNLGKSRHQGIETEFTWQPKQIDGLDLRTGYTYIDTEQRSGQFKGNELPLAAHHQLNFWANYSRADWNWNLNGLYQSKSFSDGANTLIENEEGSIGRIPSFWVWNAQITRNFRWDKRKIKAGLAINNMFNHNYFFRGVDFSRGRMPAPGRTLLFTAQLDF
ncbi:Fe(3+) dicitrate transport protein [Nitrosomonas aestuarii]|uniref:Fe(3+) dicitrate transport protein n=1 Tax=Nitrosomonas aestuarii TaxID=52441 RepID=A0A1I4DD74_9PROT|nr:TonB-dependent siderophore receptor [Nitrosomonas aestuarii]SFK90056.1 Fe(3+) dicitrate transport protein [Nitrosomonas aestuarii]